MELGSVRLRGCAGPGRHDHVTLFDQPVDVQVRGSDEVRVVDLRVVGVRALEMLVAGDVPDDILGETGEDLPVIRPAPPLEVALDHSLPCGHWISIRRKRRTGLARRRPEKSDLIGAASAAATGHVPERAGWSPSGHSRSRIRTSRNQARCASLPVKRGKAPYR